MSIQFFYGIKAQQAYSSKAVLLTDASTGAEVTIPTSTEFIVVKDVFISLSETLKWKADIKDLHLPLNSPLIVYSDGTRRRTAFVGRRWEIEDTDDIIVDHARFHRIEGILSSPELTKIGVACGQPPALNIIQK